MTKLLFAVLYEDRQVLEVTVEDESGKRRRIDIRWKSRDLSSVPDHWWSSVTGEVDLQRADDAAAKAGRILF